MTSHHNEKWERRILNSPKRWKCCIEKLTKYFSTVHLAHTLHSRCRLPAHPASQSSLHSAADQTRPPHHNLAKLERFIPCHLNQSAPSRWSVRVAEALELNTSFWMIVVSKLVFFYFVLSAHRKRNIERVTTS